MFSGDSVTLVNRTTGQNTRALIVKYNGREWPIKPGVNHGIPIELVRYAKDQNPVMGSENLQKSPNARGAVLSLIGVKGKDDCSPVVEGKATERFDRSTAAGIGRRAKAIEGTGAASAFESRVADIDTESEYAASATAIDK